ncbi:MAG: hypothetical protein ACRDPE_02265 [Solirubrobacterales bacterium]
MEGFSCEAKNVPGLVERWEEWELLIVGLAIGEKNGVPIFEDTWMPIERIWAQGETMNFSIRGGPGWIGYPEDHVVRVREGA